jgi:VanZ family protein
MIKLIFHIFNIIFIFLYLYPGSILGYLIYDDYSKQPQITADFLVSSNHLYAFLLLSVIGLLNYFKTKRNFITIYLFAISIFLEVFHFVIPNRGFQFSDLFGNMLGVLLSLLIFNLAKYWRKK